MQSDYHLIVPEREERREDEPSRGPRRGSLGNLWPDCAPSVSNHGCVTRTDPDKIKAAQLFAPPHTSSLLNSNHYAMVPLLLKNVNSHKWQYFCQAIFRQQVGLICETVKEEGWIISLWNLVFLYMWGGNSKSLEITGAWEHLWGAHSGSVDWDFHRSPFFY